jgi:hypothetical protein
MNLCLKIIFINKMQTLTNMQNIFSYFNISHINNKINDYVIRNIYCNDSLTDWNHFFITFMLTIICYLINNTIYLQKLNRSLWKTNHILADTNYRFSKTNSILGRSISFKCNESELVHEITKIIETEDRAPKKINNIKAMLKKYHSDIDTETDTETDDYSKDPDWKP